MKRTFCILGRKLARKSWILALIAIDCAILSYILASVVMPPLYAAEAEVMVAGEERILEDCMHVAKSSALCNRLISAFSLSSTAEQVASSIRVERLGETSCFRLRVICQDPETSRVLTSATAYYTIEMISQLYGDTVSITYEEPTLPEETYGIGPLTISLIVLIVSLLLSALAFSVPVLAGYRFCDGKSTEMLLGVPVLAVIPGAKDRNGGIRE